jgi:hypothetical protein
MGRKFFQFSSHQQNQPLCFFKNKIIHLFSSYYYSYAFVILLCDTVMGTGIAGRGVFIFILGFELIETYLDAN